MPHIAVIRLEARWTQLVEGWVEPALQGVQERNRRSTSCRQCVREMCRSRGPRYSRPRFSPEALRQPLLPTRASAPRIHLPPTRALDLGPTLSCSARTCASSARRTVQARDRRAELEAEAEGAFAFRPFRNDAVAQTGRSVITLRQVRHGLRCQRAPRRKSGCSLFQSRLGRAPRAPRRRRRQPRCSVKYGSRSS